MSNIVFKVYNRNAQENKNNLRKGGQIPGIIYGEFLDNTVPIKINNIELQKMLAKNSSGSILNVDLEGRNFNCVVKEIQRDNFRHILHVDLQYVKPNEIIKMKIPVTFTGQEALESKNLILETFNSALELQGSAEEIPESIEINVDKMKFEDKLYAEDINLPENITVLTEPKTLLAVARS